MVQNIQEKKNPGGSNHFEQLVAKVSYSSAESIYGYMQKYSILGEIFTSAGVSPPSSLMSYFGSCRLRHGRIRVRRKTQAEERRPRMGPPTEVQLDS